MIKVKNNSNHLYAHSVNNKDYFLKANSTLDVPKEVAEIWFKTKEVVEFVEPKDAKAKEDKAKEDKKALEKENADLKAKIAKLEKDAKAKEEKNK